MAMKTKQIALLGIMLAMSFGLTALESAVCAFLPPGVRLGLANIVVMAAIFLLNRRSALIIVVLKACFVFITRGFTASIMSFFGGAVSLGVILLLLKIMKNPSVMMVSVAGAVCHNMAQLAASALLLHSGYTFYYAPILIISGTIAGTATGSLLAVFNRISQNKQGGLL